MAGLYDRLMDQIDDDDDDKKAPGLTPLDIAELPEPQRQVMFALLRDTTASMGGVSLETLQEKLDDVDDLPDILADLSKNSWLICLGELPNTRYKVNLRRKRSSTLGNSLWASLTDRLADDSSPDEKNQGKGQSGLPALSDW